MLKFLKTTWPFFLILCFSVVFFYPTIFENKLPIPADTIVGLYHPWRDFFKKDYPSGIPFKNFQITDSVRQQYPWRSFAVNELKSGILPWWNPYSFSGMPLIANLQSAVFYPLNLLYFVLPFNIVWASQIILQTFLGALFMFFYLRVLGLRSLSTLFGSLAWAGSGFFVAWLEWNTTVHVVIWMPLILLSIEKISLRSKIRRWIVVLILALSSSFLAGYLQPFFYVIAISFFYALWKSLQSRSLTVVIFLFCLIIALVICYPQVLATLQLIKFSARDIDQANWQRPDWFLPWQNLIQFVAPDFFGNPTTLNYFGVWNYQEFVGYIGIIPIVFSIAGAVYSKAVQRNFFLVLLASSLIFCLSNPISSLPFIFHVPLLSTAQPSRLILVVVFSLCVLSSYGIDWFFESRSTRKIIYISLLGLLLSVGLFSYSVFSHLTVSTHNVLLPIVVFMAIAISLILQDRGILNRKYVCVFLIAVTLIDLLRFGWKFEPFSPPAWLYPDTKVLSFLKFESQKDVFRIAAIDDRLIPPNFSVINKLQVVSGYDPLYLRKYGEYITALERGKPDISLPWGFNRIIVPKNYGSILFDLLNVKYILTLSEIKRPDYALIMTEGQTHVYQNMSLIPRVFFVEKILTATSSGQVLSTMLSEGFDPRTTAIIESDNPNIGILRSNGRAIIEKYSPNSIKIRTENGSKGFLIILDVGYPGWQATVDGHEAKIYSTDYLFRGVEIPAGNHEVIFEYVFNAVEVFSSLK